MLARVGTIVVVVVNGVLVKVVFVITRKEKKNKYANLRNVLVLNPLSVRN